MQVLSVDGQRRLAINNNYGFRAKPFFAGTYFPKHSSYGVLGLMELLPKISELWENSRSDLQEGIDKVMQYVKRFEAHANPRSRKSILHNAYASYKDIYDSRLEALESRPSFYSA